MMNNKYTFFWKGPFSQWYPSLFYVPGIDHQFNCAEQYMMYGKAMLFDDDETADKILATTSPREQKLLGRQVRGFDADTWNRVARNIVFVGNYYKFSSNKDLLDELLETGNTILVEASPVDFIWGIGLNEEKAKITPPDLWKGSNWLGLTLTRVRDNIISEMQDKEIL